MLSSAEMQVMARIAAEMQRVAGAQRDSLRGIGEFMRIYSRQLDAIDRQATAMARSIAGAQVEAAAAHRQAYLDTVMPAIQSATACMPLVLDQINAQRLLMMEQVNAHSWLMDSRIRDVLRDVAEAAEALLRRRCRDR
jgi:hypothetical protein